MKILVTRPIDEAIVLAEQLQNLGYEAVICPLLKIRYLSDLDFRKLSRYEAVIISSRNALKAIANADKNLKLLIVGKGTTNFAKQLGFTNSIYAGDNIVELKESIQDINNLLYLSGEDVSDNLDDLPKKIDRLVVYKAIAVDEASKDFLEFVQGDALKLVMLFSKRTAEFFVSLIETYKLKECCKNIISLSISEKVTKMVEKLELHSHYVAKKPNLEAMLNAIKEINND